MRTMKWTKNFIIYKEYLDTVNDWTDMLLGRVVDGAGSGPCTLVGFGISDVELLGSTIR